MHVHRTPFAGVALLLAASATFGACKGNENAAGDTAGNTAGAMAGMAMDSTANNGNLTDPQIVYLVDEANMADSTAGALAATKATNADVKSFAKLMMGEHHALRVQGQQLAQKLNVTPTAPATDPVKQLATSEMDALNSAPKGAAFDSTYIDQEVNAHKAVLDLLDKADGQAQNAELKDLIEKAKPIIQKHLDKAQDIQKKLGSNKS